MGLLDAFRKEEVTPTKVLVCQLGSDFDESFKSDLRVYKRFYPTASSTTFTSVADLRAALTQKYDILHLFCDLTPDGSIADPSGARIPGAELLAAAADANLKLLWIANDNPQAAYDAGFKTKNLKLNVILTLRRLGPNTSLFLDNLLTQMSTGQTFSKAWTIATHPEGKSVQPDIPHTISHLGRGAIVLR